jgi:hypothetical protein
LFTVTPVSNISWTTEAGSMHSMQFQYFPHATGNVAGRCRALPKRASPPAQRGAVAEAGAVL